MHNLIKLASVELNKPDDIVRTAGILRMLKNKFLSMFDSDRADSVNKMLDTTTSIKPLLAETYKVIKKIESAINDLDIVDYNANIDLLKQKLSELNEAVKKANEIMPKAEDKKVEPPVVPESPDAPETPETKKEKTNEAVTPTTKKEDKISPWISPDTKRDRAPSEEDFKEIYKGKDTLAQLGVTNKDIRLNMAQLTPRHFCSSWGAKKLPQNQEDAEALSKAQDIIIKNTNKSMEAIGSVFYNHITNMTIMRIKGRELNAVDHPTLGNKGTKKHGCLELDLESDMLALPIQEIKDLKFKMKFVLVDKREVPTDPLKYNVYLHYVIGIRNDDTGDTIKLEDQKADTGETND